MKIEVEKEWLENLLRLANELYKTPEREIAFFNAAWKLQETIRKSEVVAALGIK